MTDRDRPTAQAIVVAPHPDDEVLGCAAVLHRGRRHGHPRHRRCAAVDRRRRPRRVPVCPPGRVPPGRGSRSRARCESRPLGFGDLVAWQAVEEICDSLCRGHRPVGRRPGVPARLPAGPPRSRRHLPGGRAGPGPAGRASRTAPGGSTASTASTRSRRLRFGWLPPQAYGPSGSGRASRICSRSKGGPCASSPARCGRAPPSTCGCARPVGGVRSPPSRPGGTACPPCRSSTTRSCISGGTGLGTTRSSRRSAGCWRPGSAERRRGDDGVKVTVVHPAELGPERTAAVGVLRPGPVARQPVPVLGVRPGHRPRSATTPGWPWSTRARARAPSLPSRSTPMASAGRSERRSATPRR